MRKARIKADAEAPVAVYHCISRVVDRRFALGKVEKDHFVRLMRKYEAFCGVRILTYCIMDNHFHLLVEVPRMPEDGISEAELMRRVRKLYGKEGLEHFEIALAHAKSNGPEAVKALTDRMTCRMHDISAFMKVLKQRFTQWYNPRHERKGTLWEERFKSVLVERSGALLTMAAYIDLNPVRAGIVEDPKDYRWSGYGEAVSGQRIAVNGLAETFCEEERPKARKTDPGEILEAYRVVLFGKGEADLREVVPGVKPRGFDREKVREVIEKRGKLSRAELLMCRIRYFSDGVAIGSQEFVGKVFEANRDRFGPRRKRGPTRLKGGDFAGLYGLRDLKVDVISC